MDTKTKIGNLGELRVAYELTKLDYEVYTGFGGKTSCDLLVVKDGIVEKVQIKSTSYKNRYGSWYVMVQTVRSNKNLNVVKPYDKSLYDILAVYIEPEDRVIIYRSADVMVTSGLTIKPLGEYR